VRLPKRASDAMMSSALLVQRKVPIRAAATGVALEDFALVAAHDE